MARWDLEMVSGDVVLGRYKVIVEDSGHIAQWLTHILTLPEVMFLAHAGASRGCLSATPQSYS